MFRLFKLNVHKLQEKDLDDLMSKCEQMEFNVKTIKDDLKNHKGKTDKNNIWKDDSSNKNIRGALRSILQLLHSEDKVAKEVLKLELMKKNNIKLELMKKNNR